MKMLDHVLELQTRVSHLHPIFEQRFPVVVLEDQLLEWFDPTDSGFTWRKSSKAPEWLCNPIQAAFPLEGTMACIMDSESLRGLDGAITVMHEFVHCYQFETCETKLKSQLEIAQYAMQSEQYAWEIEHLFPYTNREFEQLYTEQLRQSLEPKRASDIRAALRRILEPMDFEYMQWQEWKEGSARYFENIIRRELDLPLASSRSTPPFDRVSFYAGGEALISLLIEKQPDFRLDLERLFGAMNSLG
jgi:hypothetical protein